MKRLVRILLVDPNENVPAEQGFLYSKELLTEDTDQELSHSMNITEILEKYNEVRTKILDKKRSIETAKDIYLEPAKLRDLVLRIKTVEQF